MRECDQLTARNLLACLCEKWPDLVVSLITVKQARRQLGWIAGRPKYCQLVQEEKRLKWCQDMIAKKESFDDVIFTDECSVQLDSHGKLCFRMKKEPRKLKPRPKHPVKVHIWGGISKHGATLLVMFTGIMNAEGYCIVLDQGLMPFVQNKSYRYRFQQDNDPKHVSKRAQQYFDENGINWWRIPPESPDLNPIKNVWGALKYFLHTNYKPKDLASLEAGIVDFWQQMTPLPSFLI